MRPFVTVLDRTAVLFLGIAAGVAIGYAFGTGGDERRPATATPQVAPPPPGSAAAPTATVTGPGPIAAIGPGTPPPIEPPPTFRPQLLDAVAQDAPVRIGVFGDSFGDGVWSGLYHLLPAKRHYEVIKFSQQSTGFTRYASLNLETRAAEQIAARPIDIAVINYGANDTQAVFANGHLAPLLSPAWKDVIGARIDGLVRVLRSNGAMVYWVGLPRMRKASFDADIAGLNAFYAERMKALGVPFFETASRSIDAQGQYAPYLPDGTDPEPKLMRANDGIHMSMNGYIHIVRPLAQRIDAYVAAAHKAAVAEGRGPPVAPRDDTPKPAGSGL